jgi:hypothetical protein
MANNPVVLLVRFLLEIAVLFALGYWGWALHTGLARALLTVGLPIFAAIVWGVFRTPGYPGNAPVPVPGPLRLALEVLVFGAGVWAFSAADRPTWAWVFATIIVIHYLISYDYVIALLRT